MKFDDENKDDAMALAFIGAIGISICIAVAALRQWLSQTIYICRVEATYDNIKLLVLSKDLDPERPSIFSLWKR